MKKIIILSFLIGLTHIAFSQKECGSKTPPEAEYDESLRQMRLKKQDDLSRGVTINSTKYVRIKIYNFYDGTDSAWTKAQINVEFQLAKTLLAPYNICLVLEGVVYIQSTTLIDFDANSGLNNLISGVGNSQSNAVNCYLHRTLNLGALGLNGYAYNIGRNYLSLSRGALTQRSFAHELGHCFGLLHVFETGYGLECPDGSNGTSAGDKLPSTKATPDADSYLANNTNTNCIYTGNQTIDCNGAIRLYNPEIVNMMCYGNRTCRSIFSLGQEDLMHVTLLNSYLSPTLLNYYGSTPIVGNILVDDVKINDGFLQIGNNAASINTNLGNTALQRFISETQVKLTPGVRIVANTNRCRVVLKTTNICYGIIN
jgi:Pregnancy-associated plasma protein-A